MKQNSTLFILLLAIPILIFSCKKNGEIIEVPSFGQFSISLTSPSGSSPVLLQVDGVLKDTLEGKTVNIKLEAGKRQISIVDLQKKKILDTTVMIEPRKPISLTCFFNGTTILVDNLDPTVKPQTDSLLIRFVTTDKILPDLMDIEISLYDFGGTLIPLKNKTLKGIRKDKFSTYIQLPHPNVIDPSFDSSMIFYVIEGYDATPTGNHKKVMSIEEFNCSYLEYSVDQLSIWIPNNIISFGIGPAPADGSTTLRSPQLIFQRQIQ
jgi:hypothetical protein